MTTLSDAPVGHDPRSMKVGDVLWVLALIAAELVLGWFLYDIARNYLQDLGSLRLAQWIYLMLPCLPLALVVTVHAIRPSRAPAALVAALAVGAMAIGQNEFTRWLFTHHTHVGYHLFQAIGYVAVMASATLATLAWGLSRRHGRAWLLGLLVAPAGAALTLWTRWTQHVGWGHSEMVLVGDHNPIRRFELVYSVSVMLPIVAACVVCWLIDVAEQRRTPEIGSSA